MAKAGRIKGLPPASQGAAFQPPWMQVPYFAREGQAAIDGVEHLRGEMERRWGVGRLRLVVSQELRQKFDRQVALYHEVINNGDIDALNRECERMQRAWRALDNAAALAGVPELAPIAWEVVLSDGRVIAFVHDNIEAHHAMHDGRYVEVWTCEEVARLIEAFPEVAKAKAVFPGAEVVAARAPRPLPPNGDEVML